MLAVNLLVTSILLVTGAQEPAHSSDAVSAARPKSSWSWRIAPYLFAANVDGTLGAGPLEVETDVSFGDLVKHLEVGGFLLIEAKHERFGIAFDSAYLDFSEDGKGSAGVSREADMRLAMLALAGMYRLAPASPYELALGLRYLDADQELRVGPAMAEGSSNLLDTFVGARARWPIADAWRLDLYGDVGTGDSDLTWQGIANLGYDSGSWGLNFGYRILDYDVEDGSRKLDLALEGWLFGVEYRL